MKIILRILEAIIVIVAISCMADYIIYRETGESIYFFKDIEVKQNETQEENTNEINTEKQEEQEKVLSSNQLKAVEAFLNLKGNNGFILSSYKNISGVNLYYIFATNKYHVESDEEIKKYEKLTNSTVTSGLFKVSTEEIENLLVSKTGAQIGDEAIKAIKPNNFTYSQEDDSYYFLNSDDLFIKVKCTSGTKVADTYTVNYESAEETGFSIKGTIVLEKNSSPNNQNDWFFVSNEVIETNLH